MKNIKLLLAISAGTLLLTACAGGYSYKGEASDPLVEFNSDYRAFTHFRISDKPVVDPKVCRFTEEVGFLYLNEDNQPRDNLMKRVPANQPITIIARNVSLEACGPKQIVFTAQPKQHYVVTFKNNAGVCSLEVANKYNPLQTVDVKHIESNCLL